MSHLYLSLVCEGRSRLEYCLERAERSPSPLPRPPLAGSNVGLAAVVIVTQSEPKLRGANEICVTTPTKLGVSAYNYRPFVVTCTKFFRTAVQQV